jgi:hypothetical protein
VIGKQMLTTEARRHGEQPKPEKTKAFTTKDTKEHRGTEGAEDRVDRRDREANAHHGGTETRRTAQAGKDKSLHHKGHKGT